jgi:hypothetical protein
MSRTILPPWSEFRKTLGVEQAEPIAAFFEVFMTPWLVATEMCKMRLIYSDYDEHIKAVGKARETQLEREVLGKMFTGLETDE